jgi:hypothetical protein
VAVHRAAWAPGSTLTVEKHRRLVTLSGYRPELDLLVVDPEGRFAACCLVWLDEASGVGQFEPVGTDAE